ncbi:MAG: hypothetical protein JW950_07055 [Deltaproteobacteria bacterium]|nr:hypothetical protein [Deltaproteobacteria bacterium]
MLNLLDSRFRGNDKNGSNRTFYGFVMFEGSIKVVNHPPLDPLPSREGKGTFSELVMFGDGRFTAVSAIAIAFFTAVSVSASASALASASDFPSFLLSVVYRHTESTGVCSTLS